jgi:hypothetical protein
MQTPLLQDRRGMALPLALFALVITSAMMMGVFYVGRLEQRMGGGSVRKLQAFEAAEAGAAQALDNWVGGNYNNMAVGATSAIALDSTGMTGGASYSGFVYKMSDTKYLIQTDGQLRAGGGRVLARQRVARLVIEPPRHRHECGGHDTRGIAVSAAPTSMATIRFHGVGGVCGPLQPHAARDP